MIGHAYAIDVGNARTAVALNTKGAQNFSSVGIRVDAYGESAPSNSMMEISERLGHGLLGANNNSCSDLLHDRLNIAEQ